MENLPKILHALVSTVEHLLPAGGAFELHGLIDELGPAEAAPVPAKPRLAAPVPSFTAPPARPPMPRELDRADWLENYFDWNPGEHIVEIEPTGGGKTHLAYQMLGEIMRRYPGQSYVSLMPEPADPSTATWAKALNLRETPTWPPQRKLFQPKPAGHVLWPRHRMDLPPAERRRLVGDQLRAGLNAQYVRGNSLSLIDDAHSAATYMDLNDHIEEILVNGRAGGAAAFLALQKPSGTVNAGGITTYAYSSPTHYLFGKDTEGRNLKRLSEIGGGIDPGQVEDIVRNLRLYRIGKHTVSQKLYVDKRGPYMALIGP